jgi:methylated-DNA-[protein]-cysteine S-methyltransferase
MNSYFDSPVGTLEIAAGEQGISSLYFREGTVPATNPSGILKSCFTQLKEYFEGKRKIFTLDLDLEGTDLIWWWIVEKKMAA